MVVYVLQIDILHYVVALSGLERQLVFVVHTSPPFSHQKVSGPDVL